MESAILALAGIVSGVAGTCGWERAIILVLVGVVIGAPVPLPTWWRDRNWPGGKPDGDG